MPKGLGCFVVVLATVGIWFVGIFVTFRVETYWALVTFLILGGIPILIWREIQKPPSKTPPN